MSPSYRKDIDLFFEVLARDSRSVKSTVETLLRGNSRSHHDFLWLLTYEVVLNFPRRRAVLDLRQYCACAVIRSHGVATLTPPQSAAHVSTVQTLFWISLNIAQNMLLWERHKVMESSVNFGPRFVPLLKLLIALVNKISHCLLYGIWYLITTVNLFWWLRIVSPVHLTEKRFSFHRR